MRLDEALEKAQRVLLEEQSKPTLRYKYFGDDPSVARVGSLPSLTALMVLQSERQKRPREIYEDPGVYRFESVNFDLLVRIFNQIPEADRPGFIAGLLKFVERSLPAQHVENNPGYPSIYGQASALPLICEFCVRTGYLKEFLEATKLPKFPTASLAMMIKELEEMIALNFNLFSDSELESMPSELGQLWGIAERQTYSARGPVKGPIKDNPHYKQGFSDMGKEIVRGINGIIEECRKARYFYLKGALQELPNLEIESDKIKVEGYLVKLGFSSDMIGALDAVERDYKSTSTPFQLKNCLGHLRSFIEHIHRSAAKTLAASSVPGVEDRWGAALVYLRQQGIFTLQHEEFVAKLYTLISDESVHALGADREYARLLRNVVIEYGLMFLTVLDKRGIRILA